MRTNKPFNSLKRIGTILMTLFMLLTVMSIAALAVDAPPADTIKLTNENSVTYEGGGGTAVWDGNGSLTLTNFVHETSANIALEVPDGTEIVLIGDNSITATNGDGSNYSYGISSNGSLTVSGNGILNATGGTADSSSYGAYANGGITVSGGTLNGYGGEVTGGDAPNSYGVSVWGGIVASDGVLNGYGGEATSGDSYGVYVRKGIDISGGSLIGTGGDATNSYGLHVSGGIIASDTGILEGIGGNVLTDGSEGIYVRSGDISIEDTSTLKGTGGDAASFSAGISTQSGSITIKGSGSLEGYGGEVTDDYSASCGVSAGRHYIAVSGGTLIGRGGDAAGDSTGVEASGIYLEGAGAIEGYGGAVTDDGYTSCGVYVGGFGAGIINVDSGTLTGYGGEATGYQGDSYGVYSSGNDFSGESVYDGITVSDGALNGYGGKVTGAEGYSYGVYSRYSGTRSIYGGGITVSGGALNGYGGEVEGAEGYSYGVYSRYSDHGVNTYNGVTVSGGTLTGTGGDAINSYAVEMRTKPTIASGMIATGGVSSTATNVLTVGSDNPPFVTFYFNGTSIAKYVKIAIGTIPDDKGTGNASSGSAPAPSVAVNNSENGKVSASPSKPKKGDTVTITSKPDDGFELISIIVTDANGNKLSVTDNGDGTSSFTYGGAIVTIEAMFTEKSIVTFVDVKEFDWFYDAVKYVYENDMMKGVDDNQFNPYDELTRSQLVVMLWRLAGEPDTNEDNPFNDSFQEWNETAATWAAETKIVLGYDNGYFGVNDSITREQMAVMLYNYCKYMGIELPAINTGDFSDAKLINGWASEAVQAMFDAGILNGKGDGMFDPQGTATRAEVAQLFMNFMEAIK